MTDGMDRLNDDLYHATDTDPLFVIRWPPNMNELSVTKHDLLTRLHPAPLPPEPPPPAPDPAPPPVIPIETLVVKTASLSIRAAPGVTSNKIGALVNGDTVEVQGSTLNGVYHWALLLRVNGLKFADVGFVAREFLGPKA